jgi:ubiquitin-protein ligase E3 B
VGQRSGTFSQWHELLGWYSPGPDLQHHENLPLIKKQVHLLWSPRTIKLLFGDHLKRMIVGYESIEVPTPASTTTNLLKRALERSTVKTSSNKSYRKLGSAEVTRVALVSTIYHAALTTLAQLRLDILSGLCYTDTFLHDLWILVASLGPNCGMKAFLELLQGGKTDYAPPLLMLILFCDCMTHVTT